MDTEPGCSTLHLLEQILAEPDCNAHKALVAHGLDAEALLGKLSEFSDKNPTLEPALQSTMKRAVELAEQSKSERVGTDHLLLAMLRTNNSRGGLVLKKLGLSDEKIVKTVRRLPPESSVKFKKWGPGWGGAILTKSIQGRTLSPLR
jgi:ATP-dependent Clp protease ATP-binding subunit ClpC